MKCICTIDPNFIEKNRSKIYGLFSIKFGSGYEIWYGMTINDIPQQIQVEKMFLAKRRNSPDWKLVIKLKSFPVLYLRKAKIFINQKFICESILTEDTNNSYFITAFFNEERDRNFEEIRHMFEERMNVEILIKEEE